MSIVRVDPLTDPLWMRLVENGDSTVFHSPGWMTALAETYGFEIGALVTLDDRGEPRSGVPFARIDDILGGRISVLPFSDYCDPLVGTTDDWGGLIDRLLAEGLPVAIRCLHNDVPLSDGRSTLVNRAKWHGLDLRSDLDTLWQGLEDRRAIKKAQREGVSLRIADRQEDLRSFFEMHLRLRKRKYGLLAQPYRFFENIWRHLILREKGFLVVAIREGETIAGAMFLEWRDTLYYKFNASVPDHLRHRPNDLLLWEGIRRGCVRGFGRLDFGLTDWDQGQLLQYKRKFAGEEKTISFLQYQPVKSPEEQRQRGAKSLLKQLTELFVDESVPDGITERSGELLYRFFV